MQRSYGYGGCGYSHDGGYAPQQPDNIWGGHNASNDYNSHLAKIERMPSVPGERPRPYYPSVFKIFKNKHSYHDQDQNQQQQEKKQQKNKHKKKVHMSERVEVVDAPPVAVQGGDDQEEEKEEVPEKSSSVDSRADGFIKMKRRAFELCKWKTFKVH